MDHVEEDTVITNRPIIIEKIKKASSGISQIWPWCFLLATLLAFTINLAAQENSAKPGANIHRAPPPPGATTHKVVPGERFRAGGTVKWLFGDDYRDLWTAEIEIPVLDLDRVGGGLTPLRTGGFGQTISLHFSGADGNRYQVRSLDKDPTRRIDADFRGTYIETFLQDQVSAFLPAAGLVVDPLLKATGILHSPHFLVVIPDDPRLGEFREEFAGLIGTLQLHPSEGPDDSPGFAGSRKVSGSERMWERLEENPKNRIDSRVFLKARMMDLLMNDKDRHPGQWRWARFPDGDNYRWIPVPEDRDQAFIDLDGFAYDIIRLIIPKQVQYDTTYPSLYGLSMSAWELDREILVTLEKPVWEEVAAEIQEELTDEIIAEAVQRLPEEYYALIGARLKQSLITRRDNLREYALAYYPYVNEQADVYGTDKREYAEFEFQTDGNLKFRIGRQNKSGKKEKPYIDRVFHPDETKEVRVYLKGGDDHIAVSGGSGRITLLIDGGGGDDTYVNLSGSGSGTINFYDSRGRNNFEKAHNASVSEREYHRPPGAIIHHRFYRDWGKERRTLPFLSYDPDLGILLGATLNQINYGYRKHPFSNRHGFTAALASQDIEPFFAYDASFRQISPNIDLNLYTEYSGIKVIRFYGYGNNTRSDEPSDFFKVKQREFSFRPSFVFQAGKNLALGSEGLSNAVGEGFIQGSRQQFSASLGMHIRYSDTPENKNAGRFIGSFENPVYGTGKFGQIGLQGGFQLDSRDSAIFPTRGFLVRTSGAFYPAAWDVTDNFGRMEGSASAYLSAGLPGDTTLALRFGGNKVWGKMPFHEAAYLGGPKMLRGFRRNRFAGDASVYANAELRLGLFDAKLLLPARIGILGASDTGRVFLDEEAGTGCSWHNSFGGGVWISFLRNRLVISTSVMNGDNISAFYFKTGFMF